MWLWARWKKQRDVERGDYVSIPYFTLAVHRDLQTSIRHQELHDLDESAIGKGANLDPGTAKHHDVALL
jgi:hypothetical protein